MKNEKKKPEEELIANVRELSKNTEKLIQEFENSRKETITKEELTQIIDDLTPTIHELISKEVKKHFIMLSDAIKQKLS
jgi:arsenate reductase-like glutaredoxin family protein